MGEWQPISTEPKDRTMFLGYYDEWQCVMFYDAHNKVYLTDDSRSFAYPTHWQPLPNPPEEQQ